MSGLSQGVGKVSNISDGLMTELKYGDDAGRAIAQGIVSVQVAVDERLFGAKAQQLADHRLRRHLGVPRGTCMDCREPIPQARLDAMPFATRCVSCQEAVDPRSK